MDNVKIKSEIRSSKYETNRKFKGRKTQNKNKGNGKKMDDRKMVK
jgi:hypothetical protein